MSGGGSVKDEQTNSNVDKNTYGYRTPTLSTDWTDAYKKASGNLNAGGYTPDQQKAINNGLSSLNATHGALTDANVGLAGISSQYDPLKAQLGGISNQGAHLLGAAPTATATNADYAGDVTAKTGADFMGAYKNPWDKDVIDASVGDYNTNVDRTLNGMRAGRNASGAFGDRAAIADAVYQGDATRGLGTLVSGLRQAGFNTEAGLGMQDAGRTLLADQGNQNTKQGLLTANAQRATDISKYNSGLLDTREQANVASEYKNDAQKMVAISGIQDTLKTQAGLTQGQLDNVFKGSTVDQDAAKALFQAGQISHEQLSQILQLAGAGNGYSYLENSNTNTDNNTLTTEAHFSSNPLAS